MYVSIEYGLCEMLNKEAIRGDLAPKEGQRWGFNIPELEALFPAGMWIKLWNECTKRRPVFDKDQPTTAGKFEVVKNLRQTGLSYSLEIAETGDLSLPSE
ncbi:Phosphoglycerate mutase family protein [Prunus dulcis]|uniref:Phosphoglycerate mutase family protein n=1 Tax=Prunus dulcis TaxID=3755 RepID=A0A4Y1QZM9_PRUDU|nr:Phosphoglycerate mutase family protein [Prunus dulcis]